MVFKWSMRNHCTLLEWSEYKPLGKMWEKRSSYSLQILNATFEDSMAISHKIKFTHTIRPGIHKKEKVSVCDYLGARWTPKRAKRKKKNNQQHGSLRVVEIPWHRNDEYMYWNMSLSNPKLWCLNMPWCRPCTLIVVYQCRFMDYTKRLTLVVDLIVIEVMCVS